MEHTISDNVINKIITRFFIVLFSIDAILIIMGCFFRNNIFFNLSAEANLPTWFSSAKLFLIGITKREEGEYFGSTGTIHKAGAKLIKNGKVISNLEFIPIQTTWKKSARYPYSIMGKLIKDKIFSPPVLLAQVTFNYEACDFDSGDIFFSLNNNNIEKQIMETYSFSEFGSSYYDIIYPGDKDSMDNYIIFRRQTTMSDAEPEDSSGKETTEKYDEKYLWTNGKFKQLEK